MNSADPVAALLAAWGCPADKAGEMARQLERRARQLAERDGCSAEESLARLLSLMRQGWAAREREAEPPPARPERRPTL